LSKNTVHRLGLQFDDNTLVPYLFGEHGSHLSRIEDMLGVDISTKGNEIVMSGTLDELKAAQTALDSLWERLRTNLSVGPDEVDAAIRIANSSLDPATRDLAKAAFIEPDLKVKTQNKHITARSPNQAKYLKALREKDLTFGLGPAGTGKTYLAVAQAVEMLQNGDVDRLILCRPAVEAGENLGFLPGDLQEKVDPYLRPIYDALHEMLPAETIVQMLAKGQIEVAPLAFMRGRTLSNAFIVLDEAQNTTKAQMKMALTRIGENSRMAITGDPSQIDLPRPDQSGLVDAMHILKGIRDIGFIKFNDTDVVRHHLVSKIVRAYDKGDKKAQKKD